jgi:hypothetical protein
MLGYLRFRWKLWRNERWQRQTAAGYNRDIEAAKKRGDSHQKIYEIESIARHEDQTYDEDIHTLHTRYLFSEAHRLILPTPDWEDKALWEDDEYAPRRLNRKGIAELRAAIRAETKVRREQFLMWIPAIGALTGLVGAAIGLVSLLLK